MLTHDRFLSPQHRDTLTGLVCVYGCVINQQRPDLSAGLRRRLTRTLPHVSEGNKVHFVSPSIFYFFLHWNKCRPSRKTHGCRHTSRSHTDHSRRKSTASQLCVRIGSQPPPLISCRGADDSKPPTHEPVHQFYIYNLSLSLRTAARELNYWRYCGDGETKTPERLALVSGFFSFTRDQKREITPPHSPALRSVSWTVAERILIRTAHGDTPDPRPAHSDSCRNSVLTVHH